MPRTSNHICVFEIPDAKKTVDGGMRGMVVGDGGDGDGSSAISAQQA